MRTASPREASDIDRALEASRDQDEDRTTEYGAPEVRRGGRFALRNWRVRSRLIALVLIPTLAGVAFGGLRIVSSVSSAADYERAGAIADFAIRLSNLTHELALERDLSVRFVAEGRRIANTRTAMRNQQAVVNKAAGDVQAKVDSVEQISQGSSGGQRIHDEIAQVRTRLRELTSMRQVVANTEMLAQPAMDMYSRAILDLHAIHNEIGQGVTNDEALTSSVGAFGALTRAKEQASRERAALVIVIASQRFVGESFDAFVSSRAQRDSELVTFRSEASLTQRQAYDDTVSGPKKDQAEQLRIRALIAPTLRRVSGIPLLPRSQVNQWFSSTSDVIENMRDVQKSIGDSILVRTKQLQQAEQNSALIGGVIVTVLLLLVLAITVLMAQSLVRPLRTLRTEALSIAGRRLPETVQKLREGGENAAPLEISPIGVVSDDEIGEVARAFDEVHREAVRLAGQEATLRSNVNAMFVNLSRRSQTLVERQLSLIESLEQGEQDEARLGSLFRLDHLATRMRRNSENLLVLAGQEPARRWSQPIPLIDVVRASLSEVENYERVNLQLSTGVAVVGTSVNDVVHLIAELVENAISFSPRETKVIVSSNRIDGGGVMISVSDIGIGVTPEELAQANWRLANPPVVDVSVSRRMGLFVVGRLALRHGIRVQLRQQDGGGLTAMVQLPENMLSAPANRQMPGGPGMSQSGDWAGSMTSMDRAPVMASPTSLDPAQQAFASFEAAQRSFDIGQQQQQQFNSFEAPRPSYDGGQYGRPAQGPPSGTPSWANTSQVEPGPWPNDPMRGGDSGIWSQTSNALNTPVRGADSDVWSNNSSASTQAVNSEGWGSSSIRGGDSVGWPSTGNSGMFERRGFDTADNTGPLPVVPDSSPMEEAREEFLPIFAAVESDWFRKVEPVAAAPVQDPPETVKETSRPQPLPQQQQQQQKPQQQPAPAPESWSSPADVGWQAAQAASEPSLGGVTGSGLPKRVPKANLVPGTAAPDLSAASQTPMPRPVVSPEAVRNRLASFQQGVRQGRAAARGETGDGQPYPDFGRNVEGN